jgi:hypothetical protein
MDHMEAGEDYFRNNPETREQIAGAGNGLERSGIRARQLSRSFLSLDPVLEAGSPQQMGGYTYAGDSLSRTPTPPG